MFVYNVKLNSKNIVKISLFIISVIIVILFLLSLYKILSSTFKVNDNIPTPEISYINVNEYTNVLKSVYEKLDNYVGQKICFSGYVYRNLDFSETQFVLARDMIINSRKETIKNMR